MRPENETFPISLASLYKPVDELFMLCNAAGASKLEVASVAQKFSRAQLILVLTCGIGVVLALL